jgi:hypothetical protein
VGHRADHARPIVLDRGLTKSFENRAVTAGSDSANLFHQGHSVEREPRFADPFISDVMDGTARQIDGISAGRDALELAAMRAAYRPPCGNGAVAAYGFMHDVLQVRKRLLKHLHDRFHRLLVEDRLSGYVQPVIVGKAKRENEYSQIF